MLINEIFFFGHKKIFVLLFALPLFLFISCIEKEGFKVEGIFKVTDPTPVKLYRLLEQKPVLIDSVNLIEGNKFELKGQTNYPSVFLLKFFNDQSIFLVIKQGDKISIDIDNSAAEISYYVEGSYDSKLIKELNDKQQIVLRKIDQLSRDISSGLSDTLLRRRADSIYANLIFEHRKYTKGFIHKNPGSLANILALYQNFGRKSQPLFDRYDDLSLFNFVDSNLVSRYPNSEPVIALNREVVKTKDQIRQQILIEKTISEGRALPKLVVTDIKGDSILVNIDPGKINLIYFWASWNLYSVEELLKIDGLYEKYKNREIIIITVSLDSSKEKLNAFLTEHACNVPVVCDYHYWDSEIVARFAVKRIPTLYITNRLGIVVAKDIYSQELADKINLLLK